VKCDDEPGSIGWTRIARQVLLPGEPPMRTLSSGEDLLGRARTSWWRGESGAFQTDCLAADHLEPGSPDAAPWPVTPEHWGRSVWCAGRIGRW